MIKLQPVIENPEDYEELETKLILLFKEELYKPLLAELEQSTKTLQNAKEDLIQAIRSGRIYFYRGVFKGRLDSTISRELRKIGAEWDRQQGVFKIPLSALNQEVKMAIVLSEARFNQKQQQVLSKLNDILPEVIIEKLNIEKIIDSSIFRVNKRLEGTLENISIPAKLTDHDKKTLKEEFTKNFKDKSVELFKYQSEQLREKIIKHSFSGQRYEGLIKEIKHNYAVSTKKAKFIARQETHLMMSKFKISRYAQAGIKEYTWHSVVGSPLHPVRPRHKELAEMSKRGTIFRFDDPPMMDDGHKKNPGEDYNCRCYARPVIRFTEDSK